MLKHLLALTSLVLMSVGVCAESNNTPSKWKMVPGTTVDNQQCVYMHKIAPLKRAGDVVTTWSSTVRRDDQLRYITGIGELKIDCKRKKFKVTSFNNYINTNFQFNTKIDDPERDVTGVILNIYDLVCTNKKIDNSLVFELSTVDELVGMGIAGLKTFEEKFAPDPMK